jgi:hypothetical protein
MVPPSQNWPVLNVPDAYVIQPSTSELGERSDPKTGLVLADDACPRSSSACLCRGPPSHRRARAAWTPAGRTCSMNSDRPRVLRIQDYPQSYPHAAQIALLRAHIACTPRSKQAFLGIRADRRYRGQRFRYLHEIHHVLNKGESDAKLGRPCVVVRSRCADRSPGNHGRRA